MTQVKTTAQNSANPVDTLNSIDTFNAFETTVDNVDKQADATPTLDPTTPHSSTPLHPIVGDRVIEGDGTSIDAWRHWQGLHTLPKLDINANFPSVQASRVLVFAPHPDDEILGCGGLLQQLSVAGKHIEIVYVTDGSQSHPKSTLYPPHKLQQIRPQESVAALKVLGVTQQVSTRHLKITDGTVYAQQTELAHRLATFIQPNDILVAPFVHDGHPDHEATGQVVADYAKAHNMDFYQVLIWAWHWAKPDDPRIPWQQALRLDLNRTEQQQKAHAINCFQSQITVDNSTGAAPILSATTIDRICQPWEVYLYES